MEVYQLHTVHFNTTRRCNLNCTFCYNNASSKAAPNLPLDTITAIADDIKALGVKRVVLSGGEPFVRKNWQAILDLFVQAAERVSFSTNGTMIDERKAAILSEYENLSFLLSIDGSENYHDKVRGKDGTHKKAVRALKALKKHNLPVEVNATMCRNNLSEAAYLTRLARDLDIQVRLSLLHANGRGKKQKKLLLQAKEILHLREYCKIMKSKGVKIYLNLPPLLQYGEDIIPTLGASCGWAVNFCGILANGDVSICGVAVDEPSLVAGNVRTQRFADIWNDAALFKKTRSFKAADLKGVCGKCPFINLCGGACRLSAYRTTGDFLAPYELCQQFYEKNLIKKEVLFD